MAGLLITVALATFAVACFVWVYDKGYRDGFEGRRDSDVRH